MLSDATLKRLIHNKIIIMIVSLINLWQAIKYQKGIKLYFLQNFENKRTIFG